MQNILLVIHFFVALALIGIILIQRTSSDGLGLSGGSNNSFLSGRTSSNLLTRTTAILAIIFMSNSMVLAYMATRTSDKESSIIEKVIQQDQNQVPAAKKEPTKKPAEPSVPVAQ